MTNPDESGVAAILLAAGRSSRYRAGDPRAPTKLVAELDGVPLVRRAAEAALSSRARPLIVVTGHEEARVRAALAGMPVLFAHNPDYASGLASSLKTGLREVPPASSAALVLLGDMPRVSPRLIDRLIAAFEAAPSRAAVVPTYEGARGNPALLARRLFAQVESLAGDQGARLLIEAQGDAVLDLACDSSVALDVDTPEDLRRAQHGREAAG